MQQNQIALLITFLLGVFIAMGAILAFFLQKKQKVLDFIFALALSLIVMLIVMDLLPEIIEVLGTTNLWLFIIFGLLGILLFKMLDELVPEHHEHHDHKMTKKENVKNIIHIGTLATIALMIHNIVEGMAIYIAAASNVTLGIMMSLGVGLHNIPLGMVISTTFYQSEEKKDKFFVYIIGLCLSSFVGGLLAHCFHITNVNDQMMGSILSLTLGMLVYIVIFELTPKVMETKDKKMSILGLLLGIFLSVMTIFF